MTQELAVTDLYWQAPDGLRLHALDYEAASPSRGLPVICLHGLTRNARDFDVVAPRIAALGRRVFAVDVRGRGWSDYDPNPANYQIETYAQDVMALLDVQGLSRANIIGTSMGGLIGLRMGAMRPSAIASLTLNDIGPELSPVGLGRIASYVGQSGPVRSWAEAADYARSINGVAFPAYETADWDRFARRLFREDAYGQPRLDYDPAIAKAFVPTDPPPPPIDPWPGFITITSERPTLLIRGGLSDLIDARLAAKMRQAAPAMVYAEVPDVGHAPMLDEPSAWSALEAFLSQVD